MKRRLFNLMTAVSLMLLLALLADIIFRRPAPAPPPTMVITQNGGVETFTYHVSTSSGTHTYPIFGVRISFVTVLLMTGVLPFYWLLLRVVAIFAARPAPGLCPVCKYDLRATPDRCPECGNVPPKNVSSN